MFKNTKATYKLAFSIFTCKTKNNYKSKLNNILVRGEPYYQIDIGHVKDLFKRGKSLSSMKPNVVNKGVKVNAAKKTDVDNLLQKHFGINWKNSLDLDYFKKVLIDEGEVYEKNSDSDFGNINEGTTEFI